MLLIYRNPECAFQSDWSVKSSMARPQAENIVVIGAGATRMTGTLMETYLGRDAGQRVLSGRIMRGGRRTN